MDPPRIHFKATLPSYLKTENKERHPITQIALYALCFIFPPLFLYDWVKRKIHLFVGRRLIANRNDPYRKEGLLLYNKLGAIPISLTTPDRVVLDGQYWPSTTYHKNPKTIIMFNGNRENYESKLFHLKFSYGDYSVGVPYHNVYDFNDAGHNLVVFNYRGIGDSTGNVSCRGLKFDAETVYQFVRDYLNVPDEKIVLFGHSFGGAVATSLAKNHPVKLFNVRSFASLSTIARYYAKLIGALILKWLNWTFNVVNDWKKVKGQKWIVYHKDDKIIPHPYSLFKAIDDPNAIQMKDINQYADELCRDVPVNHRNDFREAIFKSEDDAHNRALSSDEMSVILKLIDN
jgi:pimeloyl-ACP methyl ester carboxylesterase